ncbi:MAG: carbamoyltransferase HypF [Nitrospirae bacterium]|nr:carbamoyltransferase HypF [Nitrospirota bacterium]
MKCLNISIKGIVQGVGFRPFIYNLASEMSLKGFITNTSDGVFISVEGINLNRFTERIKTEAPAIAKIMSIETFSDEPHGYADFKITESKETGSFTHISPDISICNDCLSEMLDKNNRRYLYPFINCTNCGPRFTITKAVPYDRPNTTMSVFTMCPECEAEYNNPDDRRFHAQPNACPVCGPTLELKVKSEKLKIADIENSIEAAINILRQGAIVAVKGLGGFHFACDATNKDSVEKLRNKKRKGNKPFALMAPDIKTIENYCEVSENEKNILTSSKRPVVLLRKKDTAVLPEAIAPNSKYLGFMLPYTPLHYLLFYHPLTYNLQPVTCNFAALVMTSGNLSEEPIVIDNNEATAKLSDISDAFLVHNRDIFMRSDDSVVTRHFLTAKDKPLFIRRSRGYTPEPIDLHDDGPEVLGCGADIKNTFTLTKGDYAIPSQHIGDMENYETVQFFEESLNNLKNVYRVNPVAIAYDLHPGYLSTKWALSQSSKFSYYGIQHHYAHIASVMAENVMKRKVIGVAFDGTGYGTDGNLWGSEFLIADISGFKRAGHFKYIPLPGGEMAIKEPWRTATSYIRNIAGDESLQYLKSIGFIEKYGTDRLNDILKILDNRDFSPLSSGAGRLFDAVSAILGICDKNTFEGEAAAALESYTIDSIEDDYPVNIVFREKIEVDFSMTILRLIEDMRHGIEKNIISTKFHNTIVAVITGVAQRLSTLYRLYDVVLSGGVFQNVYLLKNTDDRLKSAGLNVYINQKVPPNDAGISLGQAYIVRERAKGPSVPGQ